MKIGELAKLTGCSVQTIRYYEKGVLGIFPRKQTKSSRAAAISGLPGGITFPEPVNIPRLST